MLHPHALPANFASEKALTSATTVLRRCLSYASVQQVHLYDAAGHLKGCHELLQDSISQLAQQEGRSIGLKVKVHCGADSGGAGYWPSVVAVARGSHLTCTRSKHELLIVVAAALGVGGGPGLSLSLQTAVHNTHIPTHSHCCCPVLPFRVVGVHPQRKANQACHSSSTAARSTLPTQHRPAPGQTG